MILCSIAFVLIYAVSVRYRISFWMWSAVIRSRDLLSPGSKSVKDKHMERDPKLEGLI